MMKTSVGLWALNNWLAIRIIQISVSGQEVRPLVFSGYYLAGKQIPQTFAKSFVFATHKTALLSELKQLILFWEVT
jgi:hypothetical protein